jgi:alpha-beta hydrolase superfamily lysophospholipase
VLHAAALITTHAWDGPPVRMTLDEMTPDPELQRIIVTDPFRVEAEIPADTARAFAEAGVTALNSASLGTVPLVWLHGEDDRMVPLEGAREAFRTLRADRGAFLSYPDRGHGGILESWSEDMITDFGLVVGALLRSPAIVARM